uniref:E3 ubiquitin-protein ligase TRIM39-like n=1 Tax=Oncorhynchus gorbuscha TaxID=8017 RepID=UPI001EAF36A4|nr:E3 ubiquitin-protein ligase TRIM39-like [Oncorhynchus gorbuscha]
MATDASTLEELHSELTCPVCLELFREPVILECGHHFCRVCITQCWEAKYDEHPTCPKCRKTCAPKLRPNSLLCNVVDSVRRARAMDGKPGDQESSQEDPEERQREGNMPSSGFSFTDFSPRLESDRCEEHEEKLKLFCEDDQLAICLVCGMSRDHKTHNVIPINEAFENYKDKLSKVLERVMIQTEQASLCQVQTNNKIMLIKERAEDIEEQVSAEFGRLREFLLQEEERVKESLRREKENRLHQLEEVLKHTTEQIGQLEQTADQLRVKLRENENPAQLQGIKDFIGGAEIMFERPPEVCVDLPEGSSWDHCSVTAVTLNPDTAYPRLWVSTCCTQVSVGDIQPNLPNNPERFTRYNIVLGSQALASGQHYWVVEVGTKTAWGLGVAAASVNRKDEISLCPDDGFWTLVLREGRGGSEYEACTNHEESLLHPPRPPRRVGVYLDYGRGVVAFYDAGDMSHLFTFSDATFTEAVFPYFNPWPVIKGRNRAPLIIISPDPEV